MEHCWVNTTAPPNIGVYYNINGERIRVHNTFIMREWHQDEPSLEYVGYGYRDDEQFTENRTFEFVHCWAILAPETICNPLLKSVYYRIHGEDKCVNFAAAEYDYYRNWGDAIYYVGFGYFSHV